MKRITPENLTTLRPNQIVLIGTNESGIHGAGIALYALLHWGAESGKGFGPQGQTFGLPTKDWRIKTLSLDKVNFYVDRYIDWAQNFPATEHLVTKIGCGLAGYSVPDIAPMFKRCVRFNNFWLPQDFLDFYDGIYKAETNDEGTAVINKQGKTELYDKNGDLYAAQG
jgi:hypothetical protein